MGGANVGPEFTISEYEALEELEAKEVEYYNAGRVAMLSNITEVLTRLVYESNRWKKWLLESEKGVDFYEIDPERRAWLVKTGCRYIWQKPEALVARTNLYENLKRVGMDPENIVLDRIEHDMDKYFYAFNIVDLNKML